MKGPDSMPDADYRGFQMLTRIGNQNVRKHGRRQGRWWTPPIGPAFGGATVAEMLRCWSQIATGGTVDNHARRVAAGARIAVAPSELANEGAPGGCPRN